MFRIATFHILGEEYQGQVQSQGHNLVQGHSLAHGQGQLHPTAATICEQDVHRRVAVATPQLVIEASQVPPRTADDPAAFLRILHRKTAPPPPIVTNTLVIKF